MIKPISPEQAAEKKLASIPEFVIDAVNELLIEGASTGSYRVILNQSEVVTRIITKANEEAADSLITKIERAEVFDRGWLDFEPLFRRAGWKVDYDRPGYNESYEAHWIFNKA